MKRINIFDFPVSLGKYQDFTDNIIESALQRISKYVYVANVHMLIESIWNKGFREMARKAYLITPDGKPLTWALKLLYGIQQDRVAGMDILPDLLQKAEKIQLPVFF